MLFLFIISIWIWHVWGSKDPMLPGDGITAGIGKDKTCYPGSPEYKFKYGSEGLNTNDIKEYIRNPHKFNIKEEMDGQYYNLWSTDNDRTDANDEVVIKSVYDPSPVGYSLPASNAFTGFTTTGGNIGAEASAPFSPDKVNAKLPFDKGYYFYTKPNKAGNTFFFVASGWRDPISSALYGSSIGGYYQPAVPSSTSFGRHLSFHSSHTHPLNNLQRGYGWSVRSAEEKCVLVWLR